MTLSATVAVNRYVAAEGQLTFPFTFKLLDASHLEVFVGTQAVASGYSVSGVGNDTGGSVTFAAESAPRAVGEPSTVVTLRRNVPLDQVVDLPAQGSISSVSLEESGLDRIVMILQQLAEVDERSLKLPVDSSLSGDDTEVSPVASKLIGFNATADALATYAMDTLGSGIVPTTLMENLLADATIAEALATLGMDGASPAIAEAGKLMQAKASGVVGYVDPPMHRNLVRNGCMRVFQREGATSLVTDMGAVTAYALDGWSILSSGGPQSRITVTNQTSGLAAGHAAAMKIDCSAIEAAVGAGELLAVRQAIEAQDLQHLLYGSAEAAMLVLSFWIKSPKVGTHCVAAYQPDSGRHFVREFTVTSADSWQRVSVNFPGDTGGLINNDTGSGLEVVWPLIAGSDFQASADGWGLGQDYATSSQQNLLDNLSNELWLAEVQLEVGSVATAFERVPLQLELQRCYRYFELEGLVASMRYGIALAFSTTGAQTNWVCRAEKRATPSIVFAAASEFDVLYGSASSAQVTNISAAAIEKKSFVIDVMVPSVLTAGEACEILDDGNANSYLTISAEL